MKFLLIIALCSLVLACDSRYSHIGDTILRKKAYECESAVDSSTAELQVCHNILRECELRQKAGRFVC